MKLRILLTLVVIIAAIAMVTTYKVGEYSVSQEYAKSAAQQLNDNTDAYKVQKTQTGVNLAMRGVYWGLFAGVIFILGLVWVPLIQKKSKELEQARKKGKKKSKKKVVHGQ